MARGAPNRSPGKGTLVDTWTYDAAFSTDEGGRQTRKVAVELRLVKDFDGLSESPPYATKSVRFTLTSRDLGLALEGTDVEALRHAMWAALDERYRIAWEEWLLVKVEPRAPYEGAGSGFTFSHRSVERGVAFDGSVLLREYVPHGSRGHRISPWPEEFRERDGRTLACIPSTEANREALDEFARRIDAMRRQLAEFVKPESILRTLADIRGTMAVAGQAASAPRLGGGADGGGIRPPE